MKNTLLVGTILLGVVPANAQQIPDQALDSAGAMLTGGCRDGYEAHVIEGTDLIELIAHPCGSKTLLRASITVSVPRCKINASETSQNLKEGLKYYNALTDHARESFRRAEAGLAAYARYAMNGPIYGECLSP